MASPIRIPEVLRCLLTRDVETGRWIGHCLDFDIVTSGRDPEIAWMNLKAVVRAHVESCFTHWQKGLTFKASDEDIAIFEALKKHQRFRSDKIEFKLLAPKNAELHPLWMEGMELNDRIVEANPISALSAVN